MPVTERDWLGHVYISRSVLGKPAQVPHFFHIARTGTIFCHSRFPFPEGLFVERDMRTIGAALLTLSLASAGMAIATTTANARPAVAIHVGNVGIGVGHYRHHNHWYHHRRWSHGGYRYW
jgi:hypothetical protein